MCYFCFKDHDEGLEAAKEALDEREDQSVPTEYILKMLEVILKYNLFEFNQELYIQKIGTAMGSVPAVSYANIMMAKKIDPKILALAEKYQSQTGMNPLQFFRRFLDDCKLVWRGTAAKLHEFFNELNTLHSSLKFTMSHTASKHPGDQCDCPQVTSVPFLDTSCSIVDGKIITDLFRKETDRNQYLLPSSCHPAHVTNNIPFSLGLRIVRICSRPEDREKRFGELKQMLLERNYPSKIIDAAIERARNISRKEALKKVVRDKNDSDRPVFVVLYDPRLPSIPAIVKKHWRVMCQDPYLKRVYPKPPLVAFRRQRNIREKLIRAKVPAAPTRPRRILPGMRSCGRCVNCAYIKTGQTVKSIASNYQVQLTESFDCQTKNIIYLIECRKENCTKRQYIGKTTDPLTKRFGAHRGYVRNKLLAKATGAHFNLPGHQMSDMSITVVEKIYNDNPLFLREREAVNINLFNVKDKGINKYS